MATAILALEVPLTFPEFFWYVLLILQLPLRYFHLLLY